MWQQLFCTLHGWRWLSAILRVCPGEWWTRISTFPDAISEIKTQSCQSTYVYETRNVKCVFISSTLRSSFYYSQIIVFPQQGYGSLDHLHFVTMDILLTDDIIIDCE